MLMEKRLMDEEYWWMLREHAQSKDGFPED
jgi:hypothetical protein